MNSENLEPFGVYIHVPWCRRRCPYCDFYFEVKKDLLHKGFAAKIRQEWESRSSLKRKISSIYFGGGTPSLLAPGELAGIINEILSNQCVDNIEITIELNPEDINSNYLQALAVSKVNRLSLGVQSFCPESLKYLGRNHSAQQAQSAISACLKQGFSNLTIDLIVGVPGENIALIKESLAWATAAGITHISMYLLTVEPGTKLEKMINDGLRRAIGDDEQADVYQAMQNFIKSLGFKQYEISSYARDQKYSQHNTIYWSNGSYIGLGPGAHSMSLRADGSVERRANAPDLNTWWQNPAAQNTSVELLDPKEALKEALAFGIRNMNKGIYPQHLAERHHTPLPANFALEVQKLVSAGYVLKIDQRLVLTEKGALFADAVARAFLGL